MTSTTSRYFTCQADVHALATPEDQKMTESAQIMMTGEAGVDQENHVQDGTT